MGKKIAIEAGDILLFRYVEEKAPQTHLNGFIRLLMGQGVVRPMTFSHAGAEGSLLGNLTLRENIHLELLQDVLLGESFCPEKFLQKVGNSALTELFHKIALLDEYPHRVDEQTCKLTVLFKALVRPSRYLFLESPEKHLSGDNFKLLLKALEYRRWQLGAVTLLYSPEHKLWQRYVNKEVWCAANQKFTFCTIRSNIRSVKPVAIRQVRQFGEESGWEDLVVPKGSKKQIA